MPQANALIACAGLALACGNAAADTGHDELNTHIWADTPRGRFECTRDDSTQQLQVLTLDGHALFQEKPSPKGIEESGALASGIVQYGPGCPHIVANRQGYLVLYRDTAPPAYGLRGYLVVDFNRAELPMTQLGEGFGSGDEAIPDKKRLSWSVHGFHLHYFGYTLAVPGGSVDAPRPKAHEVYYDFGKGVAQERK